MAQPTQHFRLMANPYQHLFNAAAQEAGNLYCLWRARAEADPSDASARLALEVRLKRQLALLALAPPAAGLAAVESAVAVGSDCDWLAAGWYCAADRQALGQWAARATRPLACAALAAGIACAPKQLGQAWVSEWSRQQAHAALVAALRQALGEDAKAPASGWLAAPLAPPEAVTQDPPVAGQSGTAANLGAARVAGRAGCA